LAKRFGVSEEKIARIVEYRTDPDFTPAEQSALALAENMTRTGGDVEESIWSAVSRHFTDGEVIELVATIGAFNAFNRMANSMQVEVTA
jgi:alkylhydroperoxidase family enzyme